LASIDSWGQSPARGLLTGVIKAPAPTATPAGLLNYWAGFSESFPGMLFMCQDLPAGAGPYP
jgi:hypothetical protein